MRTLLDSGDLEPSTRMRSTTKAAALIVSAPLADQMVIKAFVEKLDGTGRRFEVVRLQGLAADEVAGTISAMMGAERETPRVLMPDGTVVYQNGYAVNPLLAGPKKEPPDRFRVEADVANNRLLFWASEFEMREVKTLLAKLGETSPEQLGGNIRVVPIDPARRQEAFDMLRKHWPAAAPNPLELPAEADQPKPDLPKAERVSPETAAARGVSAVPCAAWSAPQEPAATDAANADSPAPVKVTIAPDGQWIISSQDGKAVDRLESLLSRYRQPQLDYRIFELQYASASWLTVVLKQFFHEEELKPSTSPATPVPSGMDLSQLPISPPPQDQRPRWPNGGGEDHRRQPNRTACWCGAAAPDQLQAIERLVKYYDRPPPPGSEPVRVTDVFPVRYSSTKKSPRRSAKSTRICWARPRRRQPKKLASNRSVPSNARPLWPPSANERTRSTGRSPASAASCRWAWTKCLTCWSCRRTANICCRASAR